MIRRPPRSTLDRSSAASDVYKRQDLVGEPRRRRCVAITQIARQKRAVEGIAGAGGIPVSYTHLRAHETVLDLVCRLLLEKKKRMAYTDLVRS